MQVFGLVGYLNLPMGGMCYQALLMFRLLVILMTTHLSELRLISQSFFPLLESVKIILYMYPVVRLLLITL